MKQIPLSQQGKFKGKYFAQVDDEDFDWLSQWKWYANKGGNTFYAVRTNGRMHREIMNHHGRLDETKQIDHIDRDGLNCQKHNLRNATRSENQQNRKASGTSKYLGVDLHIVHKKYTAKNNEIREYKSYSWTVQIQVNKQKKYLGSFPFTEEGEIQGARVYNEAAKKYYGEFANLNIF